MPLVSGIDLKWWPGIQNEMLDDQAQLKMINAFIQWMKNERPSAKLSFCCKSLSEAKQAAIRDAEERYTVI